MTLKFPEGCHRIGFVVIAFPGHRVGRWAVRRGDLLVWLAPTEKSNLYLSRQSAHILYNYPKFCHTFPHTPSPSPAGALGAE